MFRDGQTIKFRSLQKQQALHGCLVTGPSTQLATGTAHGQGVTEPVSGPYLTPRVAGVHRYQDILRNTTCTSLLSQEMSV